MKIDAYVVQEKGAPFIREQLELEEPLASEIRVRVVATGVCHTDLNTQAGDMPMPFPSVLGHEGSGVVDKVGPGVTEFAVGDHVIMGWPFCGVCRNCNRGEHRYCDRIAEALCGGHRLDGEAAGTSAYLREDGSKVAGHFFGQSSFANYSIASTASVVKVDKDIPLEFVGPLACGITTGAGAVFNTAKPAPGESVVIFGSGAVGLAAVMAAKNTPAAKIIAIDLHDSRLDLAREFGATHTINSGREDAVAKIMEYCGGFADYVIDCTGSVKVIEMAAEAVGMLGKLILIGGAPAGASITLDHLRTLWGQTIVGTLGGSSTSRELIPGLLELYRQGRFPFDRLVKFYEFDDLNLAIEDAGSGETVKAVLSIGPVAKTEN